ncbi:restriction endonuclease [Coleofasciculus sp. FACHB-64]|uniref:restriction endonuclease n=1 Tax=Cyanophyceae TaxID=3028117 RepID=UPI001687C0AE|nr:MULTISPECIES: restriction endonuclease [unclassified Coleofasciculus]MBD1899179.1 restriction endonuclease [Coleofasciculus sp. FACHB-125]MBD2044794.1 restriction endonuclease [Coleofasciculus sp. FACHB-64]MBD2540951.1 restriction endonuclease [Coleofasciculus sp. FACHB-SPT36]
MKEGTIVQTIAKVMQIANRSLSISEIYQLITDHDFYKFKADDPVHIVRSQVRRHCEGLNFSSASSKKYFILLKNGTYWLKGAPLEQSDKAVEEEVRGGFLEELTLLHKKYIADFRTRILEQLKRLDPTTFEIFSKRLLEVYGFHDVEVTRKSRDGGIDGFGKLKVGLADLKVSFQSKRWKKTPVGRKEIAQFRGDIQGKCEQGYFFTTSNFTSEAEKASFQPGAVPIILVDSSLIVDLMIDKKFGVEVESLPIYSNALDLVISEIDGSLS